MSFQITSSKDSIVILWDGSSFHEYGRVSAIRISPNLWYINRFAIQPIKLREQGVGRELIRRLQDIMIASGVSRAMVEPEGRGDSLRGLKKFYASMGFQLWKNGSLLWEAKV